MKYIKFTRLILQAMTMLFLISACNSTTNLSKCPDFKDKKVDKHHKVQVSAKIGC